MPVFVEEEAASPRLEVRGSVAVETDWALSAAHRLDHKAVRPEIEDLYRRDPGLADEVRGLWGPEETLSYPGYLELSMLAHHGGRLFSFDSAVVLDQLADLAADGPANLALASETPGDRDRLLRRLEVLRSSPERRRHYVEVVGRVWSALAPGWERHGRPVVEAEIARRRADVDRRTTWQEFVSGASKCKSARDLADLVGPLGPSGEVVLVPAWFGYSGLVVDLPGVLVLGAAVDTSGDAVRARSEELAGRLKAIADPTRLAIISELSRRGSTVTELARRFGLSQPTVSNHIKMLREAGFVTPRGDGRARQLSVRRDALADVGVDLLELVGEQ
jgi:DNA-binding transcriptional ArsR family regulator